MFKSEQLFSNRCDSFAVAVANTITRDEVESRRHNYGSTVKGNVGCGPTASLCESAFDHVTSEQRSDSLTHFSRLRSSQVQQIFHCVLSAFFSSTDDLDWEHDS